MLDDPVRRDIDADVGHVEDHESDIEFVAGEVQVINKAIDFRIADIRSVGREYRVVINSRSTDLSMNASNQIPNSHGMM